MSRHWRVAVACERGVALTALLCVLSLCAQAATPAPCARIETAPRALPDPAVCLRRADIDTPATAVDSEANAARLFAHAENRIAAGRFDEAEHTLDCAQAVLGEHGDANAYYELIRRRGILDYRRERIPEALKRFECALELSTAREDRAAIARDLKNVGTSLRRLGDFRGALRELTRSLEMQRSGGDVGGAVLNNIADVYRELGEPIDAMRFYQEAIKAYRAKEDRKEAAHVLESMGELELDRGNADEAARRFEQALRGYRDSGDRSYALRVYGGLIRAALAHGDVAKANEWRASALAIVGAHGLTLPAPVQLQIARTERLSGHLDAASVRIATRLRACLKAPQSAGRCGKNWRRSRKPPATVRPRSPACVWRMRMLWHRRARRRIGSWGGCGRASKPPNATAPSPRWRAKTACVAQSCASAPCCCG